MITIGDAVLYIVGNDQRLKQTLDDVQKKVDSSMQGIQNKLNTWGNRLTVGVTAPIVAFGTMAVKNAVNLEETINKTNVVFGDAAQAVLQFGENAAKGLGMSKNEALSAAATYGNLLRATGLAADESANMSMSLVQLASDLASFNNMDPNVVLEKLRAGLTGEAEPLKVLGINMNEARIRIKAMELGLWDGVGALDAAAKAQAAYAIMLEDTKLAQGDFARTADSASNLAKTFGSEVADLSADLGTALIPSLTILLTKLIKVLEFFNGLSPSTKEAIVNFLILAAALGPVMKAFSFLAGIISPGGLIAKGVSFLAGTAGPAIAGAFGAISLPVLVLIGAIGALIAVIILFGDEAAHTVKITIEFFSELIRVGIQNMQHLASQIGQIASALAPRVGEWFKMIGRNIVDGIWNGIQSGWDWLIGNVEDGLEALVDKVKDVLDITSPSGVFSVEVGKPMAEGIGIGFQDEMVNAVSQMAHHLALMPAMAMGGANRYISVGHMEYHGKFSASELAYLDRRHEARAETMLEGLLGEGL